VVVVVVVVDVVVVVVLERTGRFDCWLNKMYVFSLLSSLLLSLSHLSLSLSLYVYDTCEVYTTDVSSEK